MEQERKYKAFISYSHRDKSFAKRLQKRIEDFKSPKYIRAGTSVPEAKIGKLFRDETDMSGYRLKEAIKHSLEKSEYLIVICSSNSAKSKWVNLEIEYFISLGRIDHIIGVIKPEIRLKDSNHFPQTLARIMDKANTHIKIINCSFWGTGFFCGDDLLRITNALRGLDSNYLLNKYQKNHEFLNVSKAIGLFIGIAVLFTIMSIEKDIFLSKFCKYDNIYWDHNMGINGTGKHLFADDNDDFYLLRPYGHYSTFDNNLFITTVIHHRGNAKMVIPGQYLWDGDVMRLFYDLRVINGISTFRLSKIIIEENDGTVRLVKNYALTDSIVDLSSSDIAAAPFFLPNDYTLTELPNEFLSSTGEHFSCRIAEIYNNANQLSRIWFLSGTDSFMIPDIHGYFGIEYIRDAEGKICKVNYLNADETVMHTEIITQGKIVP